MLASTERNRSESVILVTPDTVVRPENTLNISLFAHFGKGKQYNNIPKLLGPPNNEMPKFKITVQGVTKIPDGLNDGMASVLEKLLIV